jgi:hypothetical protein
MARHVSAAVASSAGPHRPRHCACDVSHHHSPVLPVACRHAPRLLRARQTLPRTCPPTLCLHPCLIGRPRHAAASSVGPHATAQATHRDAESWPSTSFAALCSMQVRPIFATPIPIVHSHQTTPTPLTQHPFLECVMHYFYAVSPLHPVHKDLIRHPFSPLFNSTSTCCDFPIPFLPGAVTRSTSCSSA